MLFSSMIFLSVFLPIVMLAYFVVDGRYKQHVLLAASLFFYAWGEPNNLYIVLCVCFVSYICALAIKNAKSAASKQFILGIDIFLKLGVLAYFKYLNFLIENINDICMTQFAIHKVVMPLGISFFIFQALSYVIDVYRGDVEAQENPYKLTLYISFFPQLIAGPIVKYHDIAKDIEDNTSNFDDFVYGLRRFIIGLGKKVLLANPLGQIADSIFNEGYMAADVSIAWLGAICYSLQLFYDFSGYSDMAIGLGRIFGFHFLENFNYPFLSKSITEFWRRWHISLGTWFKEYLYIPLGGNRKGNLRTYLNLFIVFCITGLWHGANWTFVLWGGWHGLFIVLERFCGIKTVQNDRLTVLRHVYTIFVFVIGWTMFRADTVTDGIGMIATMFGLLSPEILPQGIEYYLNVHSVAVLCIAILFSAPINLSIICKIKDNRIGESIYHVGLLVVLVLCIANLAASTYNPFIYFRF